jgi:hypothetical protein
MDQTKLCINGRRQLFRCIYFPIRVQQNGIGKLEWAYQEQEPPFGGKQIDPTLVFGIPMVATIGKENRPTENLQVNPDIPVALKYEDYLNGQDKQLERAVEEMLKPLNKMLILDCSSKFKQRC